MALTLAAGISTSDRYCTVNQPPTQPPGSYYRIGDEVVQHIGYVTTTPIWTPNFTQLYIARAQLGTTAASHLSAAALTYVRPEFLSATAETDPGPFETGGVGGGGVTVTDGTTTVAASTLQMPPGGVGDEGSGTARLVTTALLGPYPVAFDDVGFVNPADNGIQVATIPAGAVVKCFVITKTGWEGASGDDYLLLTLGVLSAGGWSLVESNVSPSELGEPQPASAHLINPTLSSELAARVYIPTRILTTVPAALYAAALVAGTVTAGSADVYAVVMTPAT
jgi:hypothetical protein